MVCKTDYAFLNRYHTIALIEVDSWRLTRFFRCTQCIIVGLSIWMMFSGKVWLKHGLVYGDSNFYTWLGKTGLRDEPFCDPTTNEDWKFYYSPAFQYPNFSCPDIPNSMVSYKPARGHLFVSTLIHVTDVEINSQGISNHPSNSSYTTTPPNVPNNEQWFFYRDVDYMNIAFEHYATFRDFDGHYNSKFLPQLDVIHDGSIYKTFEKGATPAFTVTELLALGGIALDDFSDGCTSGMLLITSTSPAMRGPMHVRT